jgi:hypothetical protein
MKIPVPYTGSFFLFQAIIISLIKQQQMLGAVIAEYEANNGDSSRGNLDE